MKSGRQWTDYYDADFLSLIEAICVDEIEKVAGHLETARGSDEAEHHPSARRTSDPKSADALATSVDSHRGSSEESRLLAQLRTLPEDVEAAVQDEVRLVVSYRAHTPLTKSIAGTLSLVPLYRARRPTGLVLRPGVAGSALAVDRRETKLGDIP